MKNLIICIVFSFIFCFSPEGRAQSMEQSMNEKLVEIMQSEIRIFHSRIIGQDYQIKIWFPSTYNLDQKFPVLYLLDGDHAFAMATDIVQYLNYGDHVPQMIIVSPSYNSKGYPEHGGKNMRNRDFWTEEGRTKYFAFLKEELIPFIDDEFNTLAEEKTIWGFSNGGLFVMWSLFQKPTLFNRYIAIDPKISIISASETRFSKDNNELNVKLFLGLGNRNGPEISAFIDTIENRKYKDLHLDYLSLQGEEHFIIPSTGLALGLTSVYKKESLADAMLESIMENGIDSAIIDYMLWRDTPFSFYDNTPEVLLKVSDLLGQQENWDAQAKLKAFYDQEYPQKHITFLVSSHTIPPSSNIYITGNQTAFGNWNPSFAKLSKNVDGEWEKTFAIQKGAQVEYKFTLGSWESEALDKDGDIQPNSTLEVESDTTLHISIDSWKNLEQ